MYAVCIYNCHRTRTVASMCDLRNFQSVHCGYDQQSKRSQFESRISGSLRFKVSKHYLFLTKPAAGCGGPDLRPVKLLQLFQAAALPICVQRNLATSIDGTLQIT